MFVRNNPRDVARHGAMFWDALTLRRTMYNTANTFGTGTFFVPAFVLLSCIGVFFLWINRFVICALLAGFSFLALTSLSWFAEVRLHLPLLILLVAVAVLPVTWAAKNLAAGVHRIASLSIFLLFAATCLGYPSQSGYGPPFHNGRAQVWDALHFTSQPHPPVRFIAMTHLAQNFKQQPGIILSDIDPVYLNALLPKSFVAAPLDENHHYIYATRWRYGRSDAAALARKGLDQSLPVYALFVSPEEKNEKASRLPAIAYHQWTTVDSSKEAVVLKLTPTD